MKLHKLSFIRILHKFPLVWLLLFVSSSQTQMVGSSFQRVNSKIVNKSNNSNLYAPVANSIDKTKDIQKTASIFLSDNSLTPTLALNKTEVDLCNSSATEKDFILTIDLGKSIAKTDSLFVVEVQIAYKKDLVAIDGSLQLGTLCEKIIDSPIQAEIISAGDYNLYRIQCANYYVPLSGGSRLINFTGKFLTENVTCADFILYEIFLGNEFQLPYLQSFTDTTTLCAVNKKIDRAINLAPLKDELQDTIKTLEQTITLPLAVTALNTNDLTAFDVAIELKNTENIDIKINKPLTQCAQCQTEAIDNKILLKFSEIKPEAANCFNGINPWFELVISRKNDNLSNNTLTYQLVNINDSICYNNSSLSQEFTIHCSAITNINENEYNNFLVSNINDEIVVNTAAHSILTYNVYNMIGDNVFNSNINNTNVLENIITLNKHHFSKGIYVLQLLTQYNNIQYYNNIKLIIN